MPAYSASIVNQHIQPAYLLGIITVVMSGDLRIPHRIRISSKNFFILDDAQRCKSGSDFPLGYGDKLIELDNWIELAPIVTFILKHIHNASAP